MADFSAFKTSDLFPPWNNTIIGRPMPILTLVPPWDGDAATFASWNRAMCAILVNGGVDCLAQHTRDAGSGATVVQVYGKDVVVHDSYTAPCSTRATQLHEQRFLLIRQGRARHCAAIVSGLDDSMASLLVTSDNSSDPDKLWKTITERVAGARPPRVGLGALHGSSDSPATH